MKNLAKTEILEFLKNQLPMLRETYHITKIGLFGSYARGEETENSDIDLLIELEAGTPDIHDLKNNLKEFLRSHFHRPVDLTREKYLKPYVRQQILDETLYVK